MQWVRVWSLVGELRFHMPHNATKIIKRNRLAGLLAAQGILEWSGLPDTRHCCQELECGCENLPNPAALIFQPQACGLPSNQLKTSFFPQIINIPTITFPVSHWQPATEMPWGVLSTQGGFWPEGCMWVLWKLQAWPERGFSSQESMWSWAQRKARRGNYIRFVTLERLSRAGIMMTCSLLASLTLRQVDGVSDSRDRHSKQESARADLGH